MSVVTAKTEHTILGLGSLLFLVCLAVFVISGSYMVLAVPFAAAVAAFTILNWKAAFWMLILCIPLSAEVSIFDGVLATTVPDEQLMWLFLGVLLFLTLRYRNVLPEWFLRHPLTLILALQLLWLVIAVIFSTDFLPSLKYLLAKLWFWSSFIIFPVMVFTEKKHFKRAFLFFAIPVLIHAVFAFCWHYKLNFGYRESNLVVFPFYQNHVDHSSVLSMLFPLVIIAYQLSKGNKLARLIWLAAIIFLIPAIYVAAARAAMLGVIFAFVIAFAIRKKLVQWVMPSIYTLVLLAVLGMAYNNNFMKFRPSNSTATQKTFMETVTATFTGKDMSSMERFYRWIAGVRMSTEHPLTGVGPNNFYENYKPYTVTAFKTWVSRNPERSTTHNYFLFVLVEQGWPAMLLYGALLIVMFKTAQRIYHRTDDIFYKKVAMGLAMSLAVGFVNNFFSELLETHKVGALFYISIALLIVLDYITRPSVAIAKNV
jgi:O-antigen ligase